MLKKKNDNSYLLPIIAIPLFAIAVYMNEVFPVKALKIAKQDSTININRDFIRLISMGNKRLIADLLWIQTLLDSDTEKYEKKDLNNWMFHRFITISELDPNFYQNYLWGGMYLSIIKDDLEGAAIIYDRGLEKFPSDYSLNYNGGFNYYFEMGQFEKGLKLLEKIQSHPRSPHALRFIINKLRFETGKDYEAALAFIVHNINTNKDPVLDKKLRSDLYSLKAERDLACLNSNMKDCETRDSEGVSYIKTKDGWKAYKEFKPYKIHLKSN